MGERLTGDLVLGDAEEDDHGPARRGGIAAEVRRQRLRDRVGTQTSRQGGWDGGDDLGGRDDAATRRDEIDTLVPLDPLNRAADAQLSAEVAVAGDQTVPEAAHPAPRPCQAGAPDRDPQRGVDQRCLGHGAMDRVLDKHRQQADQRPIVLQAVCPQRVGHRPTQVADQGHLAEADRLCRADRIGHATDR